MQRFKYIIVSSAVALALTAAKALHDAGTVDIVTPTQWIAGMSAAGALTAAAGPFGESSFQGGTGVLTDAAGPKH